LVDKILKIKIYFVECPKKALGKEVFAECQLVDTRAKKPLCRVSTTGPRQILTTVSFRRPLTAICQAPPLLRVQHSAKKCVSVPSVLHSVNDLVVECGTLPSAALGKDVFAECPTKKHLANLLALGKGLDSGSANSISHSLVILKRNRGYAV
jgi:hypothetical protein